MNGDGLENATQILPERTHLMNTTEARAAYTAALREIANLIELNNDLPLPGPAAFNMIFDTAEEIADARRIIGGTWHKNTSNTFFWLARDLSPHTLNLFASRDAVCERVVVGTKQVEIVDPAAPRITVDEEIVEWVCGPILSDTAEVPA